MLLSELVAASEAVRTTSARLQKIDALAAAIGRLAPDEAPAGVAFLTGELRQRQIGVGWASLRERPGRRPPSRR